MDFFTAVENNRFSCSSSDGNKAGLLNNRVFLSRI